MIKLATGERIGDLIKKSGKSGEKVLKEIKEKYSFSISKPTLSDIINDVDKGYSYKYFEVFAKYFNVSTDYLLGLTDAPTPIKTDEGKAVRVASDFTGLNGDAINYIANKKTDYNFKVFIEFLIDYAKKHKGFVNGLSFLRNAASTYHSEIEFQNVLSNYYEQDNLSDENKKALYKLYKGNENIPPTKTQLYILASLKSDYNSTKYELSENIRDIINEYSTSKIVNEETNDYFPYATFKADETKMLNSDYIEALKSEIKEGKSNETQEKKS